MHTHNLSLSCFACVMFVLVSSVLVHPAFAAPAPQVVVPPTAVPPPLTALAVTPLAQITPADEGKQVTVQATVVGTENFSNGFKLYINDTTAQVILLIWADDWDYVDNNYHLNVGAVVSTTGKVDVY